MLLHTIHSVAGEAAGIAQLSVLLPSAVDLRENNVTFTFKEVSVTALNDVYFKPTGICMFCKT